MVVQLDDFSAVYGTVPRAIERALIPYLYEHRDRCANLNELVAAGRYGSMDGDDAAPMFRVRFTATVTQARDRDGFGTYKRPRNAELLIEAPSPRYYESTL